MIANMKSLKISREEQEAMVQGMLLSNMLKHLNISLDQYFNMTTDSDRRLHISRCQSCSCVRECVNMLMGDSVDPETFCPNCADLKRFM